MGKGPSQEFLKKFGENLKKIREGVGISQRELASLCVVDHSHISKIERGEKNITILTVFELANALGVKAKKLLDFEVE
ncbi:helix-turn-helix domain-containing protein [Terrimonas alba]|uniref:helix-turn-helix domain-containing protein n=1 Tax=Terrimonas alba TaxID=3349636 RepID=UPI0035F4697F